MRLDGITNSVHLSLSKLWESLCACWGTPSASSQAVDNSTLAFMSCMPRVSRSARGERMGSFQVFLGCVYTATHECVLFHHKQYVRAFQILLWTFHSPYFFFTFLSQLLFCSSWYCCHRHLHYQTIAAIVFHKCCGSRVFSFSAL